MGARRKKGWGGRRKGAGRPRELRRPRKVSLILEEEDLAALELLAADAGVGISRYARQVLQKHLARRAIRH